MGKVIVIDRNPQVRKFIENHLNELGFEVECFSHLEDSKGTLKSGSEDIGLVLIEVSDVYYENLEYFNEFEDSKWHIPVIAMSSSNKKQVVIETIQAGADDIILKPFNEDYFDEKILSRLDKKINNKEKMKAGVNINFNKYISGEFIKARKGRYTIGIMMIQLKHKKEEYMDEWTHYKISKPIFEKLMEEFWDTDLGIQYGSHSLIGIFPFCDEKGLRVLKEKLKREYDAYLSMDSNLVGYEMKFTAVLYPYDGENREKILSKLIRKSMQE